MVSFVCPHEVPARERSTLFRLLMLAATFVEWSLKVSLGSKVTPSILGVLTSGRRLLSMVT